MLLTLPLIAAIALGADDPAPAERMRTPYFLPRYVVAGTFVNSGLVAPMVKVGFEQELIKQRTEAVVMLELSPSFGVGFPYGMRMF